MNYSIIRYILGCVLKFEALFMTLPCVVALIYREQSGFAYLAVGLVCFVISIVTTRKKPKNQLYFAREGFVIVALSWIVMSIFGALPFVLSGEIPNFTNALFETISGFTTTGASILSDVEALTHCSLLWRSFTHWVGGMGVFVFLLAILPLAGGYNMHLMRAESPGPAVDKLVPKVRDTAKILYGIYITLTLLEMFVLLVAGMPLFDTVCTAFGTAGTGGFGIKNDSIQGYSVAIQIIITIFMILFGVNFNAYYMMLRKGNRKLRNCFKMEEVRWYLAIIAVAIGMISVNIYHMYQNVGTAVQQASFQVASIITTTGFSTTDFDLWPQLSKGLLIIIMFIGACAGSTGGGIKVSRMLILFKNVKKEVSYFIHPRSVKVIKLDNKALGKDTIRGVNIFISTYVIIFAISVLILAFDNLDMVTNFTAVTATFNNIGPGLELVGPTKNFDVFSPLAKYVLMFDMLAGRLELYPLLILITPSVWRKN